MNVAFDCRLHLYDQIFCPTIARIKLDELAQVGKLYDSISAHDAQSWYWRQEVEQRYLAIVDWLEARALMADYDREQKRFVAKKMWWEQGVEKQG